MSCARAPSPSCSPSPPRWRSARARRPSTRSWRRRTSPRATSARRSTTRPPTSALLRRSARRTSAAALRDPGRRPRARVRLRPVLERQRRLRRRRAPLRLGDRRATASSSRSCSRRATARRSPATCGRPRPGPPSGPGIVITNGSVQADEQLYWFAAQTLAQGRLRRADLGPAGPGPVRHARRDARRERGLPGADRRTPVLRRHRGRARLLLLHPAHPYVPRSELLDRHEPRRQAGPPRQGRPRRGLQPVLARCSTRRSVGHRRPLLRRRGRLLRRAARPAREGDRRLGQPRRARPRTATARAPASSRARPTRRSARRRADHQAGARHVGRLLPAADAEHVGPRPAGEVQGVLRVLQGGRRHRRDRHPRRHALRLRLHPERRLRRRRCAART